MNINYNNKMIIIITIIIINDNNNSNEITLIVTTIIICIISSSSSGNSRCNNNSSSRSSIVVVEEVVVVAVEWIFAYSLIAYMCSESTNIQRMVTTTLFAWSVRNKPIQIYWKFYHQKVKIFTWKFWYFHISAQNIDCGYSLEPPRRHCVLVRTASARRF